jgi:hypothetical protein
MAQYKNKAYANNSRLGSPKDYSGYYYHLTQEQRQDKLIKEWLTDKKANRGVKTAPTRML